VTGRPSVAVLGSGIMGSAAALFLARRGGQVTLFDAASRPFTGASRWSEGKIHLGHMYAADSTLRTAARLLPGALAFKDLTEQLTGYPLDDVTMTDDTYLVHRDSIVGTDEMAAYLGSVTDLAAAAPGADRYLTDLRGAGVHRLRPQEIAADYDTDIVVAGFRVPERSVSTVQVADRFVAALEAESGIHLAMSARVTAVQPHNADLGGPFSIATSRGRSGPFDFVVNALWEGRPLIDAGLGIHPEAAWSHRYRLSMFLRTDSDVPAPSAVLTTGPFGDIKAYSGRDFYLSWYPTGLIAEGSGLAPPPVPALDDEGRARVGAEIFARLGSVIHPVQLLEQRAETIRIEGGWVFALGRGSLADRRSTLHRRDRIGIRRHGAYISVDTGKYSTAPWLALEVADSIIAL